MQRSEAPRRAVVGVRAFIVRDAVILERKKAGRSLFSAARWLGRRRGRWHCTRVTLTLREIK